MVACLRVRHRTTKENHRLPTDFELPRPSPLHNWPSQTQISLGQKYLETRK